MGPERQGSEVTGVGLMTLPEDISADYAMQKRQFHTGTYTCKDRR